MKKTLQQRLKTQENIFLDTVVRYNKLLKLNRRMPGYGIGQIARLNIHLSDLAYRIIIFNNALQLAKNGRSEAEDSYSSPHTNQQNHDL